MMCAFIFFSASNRPLTNYYQYSLGVQALCVSGVRVSLHVSQKLIDAALHDQFKHGDSVSVGEFIRFTNCILYHLEDD